MTDTGKLPFKYRGARALVILHDACMREFLQTWREFKASGVSLPSTDDPDYASAETLLCHGLGAARGYMVWMCKVLDLPDPGIRPAPDEATIEAEAESYLNHILECWKTPLVDVPYERFGEEYKSNWGETFSIDSMLEHAVMHPMRHTFQLQELMAED